MNWLHIKHDNCPSERSDGVNNRVTGTGGRMRMSIGPYSRPAAVAAMSKLKMAHRIHHTFKSPRVVCIIKIEREPLAD